MAAVHHQPTGMFQLSEILQRAQRGEAGGVTSEECLYLAKKLPSNEMPSYCTYLLEGAKRIGIISRRGSRVGRTWDISDGHGKRTMYYESAPGGSFDNVESGAAYSVDESYLASKTPEAQEKIRQLRTRMASRGALNLNDVDPSEVESEKQRILQRRASRQAEMKSRV